MTFDRKGPFAALATAFALVAALAVPAWGADASHDGPDNVPDRPVATDSVPLDDSVDSENDDLTPHTQKEAWEASKGGNFVFHYEQDAETAARTLAARLRNEGYPAQALRKDDEGDSFRVYLDGVPLRDGVYTWDDVFSGTLTSSLEEIYDERLGKPERPVRIATNDTAPASP